MIFLIIVAAFTLSFAFARLGISQDIADVIIGLNLSAVELVVVLVVFYLVLGTFMESFAMLVTTVPILVPTLQQAGVDLVWFGIIMVILIEAALNQSARGYQSLRATRCAAEHHKGDGRQKSSPSRTGHDFGCLDWGASVYGLHGFGCRLDSRLP